MGEQIFNNPIASGDLVISGSGYYTPEEKISNDELVDSFNRYIDKFNSLHADQIAERKIIALKKTSSEFIETASGIKSRYVRDKKNLLDVDKMWPFLPERSDDQLSLQAETCVNAAKMAVMSANRKLSEIDAVILSSSHKQRDFPSISIEIQNQFGLSGFAFDMGVSCSSATYGIHAAVGAILSGTATVVLVVSPEIKSGQFSTRDRDSHFIFGEATSAVIVERNSTAKSTNKFKICDISLSTSYSNNIRNNRGAYNNCCPENIFSRDKVFRQNGRLVYKEVTQLASQHMLRQMEVNGIDPRKISRFWLHQASSKMNKKIINMILKSKDYDPLLAPEILHEYGNTSSAGVIVTFSKYNKDLKNGSLCILCSFGAGYAIGSILLKKIK